jgi:hypothetical protein
VNAVERRGLVNAGVAAVVTFAIGSAVVFAAGGSEEEPGRAEPSPSASASPEPSCDPSWDLVRSADPGEAPTTLLGVAAVSSTEAWAVGGIGDPATPTAVAIQRWDGNRWSPVDGPSPGTIVNELRAVDASELNDVWAVGRTSIGLAERPLVLHYDGSEWTQVEVPEEIDGVLNGVAAISPRDVWAVGFVGDPSASLERALILHWDGADWASVEVHRAVGGGKAALLDVEWVTPSDLWAAGYHRSRPLILRFDGRSWSQSPTEVRGTVNAIEAFATSQAWAVGRPIQRFDGTTWTEATEARPETDLVDVAAVGAGDIWAVGSRPAPGGGTRSAVYRYSGDRWTPVDGPSVRGSDALSAVDALPDGTVFAVGSKDLEAERRTLAIRGTTCPT